MLRTISASILVAFTVVVVSPGLGFAETGKPLPNTTNKGSTDAGKLKQFEDLAEVKEKDNKKKRIPNDSSAPNSKMK